MKIAHVTEAWNGGISTYVNTLMELQSEAHEVSLVYSENATQTDFKAERYAQNTIRTYPYKSSRNPAKFPVIAGDIRNILRGIGPDIVHLHSTFAGVYGRIRKPEFPTVYCAHGWSFIQEQGSLKKKIYAAAEKRLAHHCQAIIHISRHESKKAHDCGILAPINAVVMNGVQDVGRAKHAVPVAVQPEHINIGYIGRLDYKKGFDIAARAFAQARRGDLRLFVIGAPCRDGYQPEDYQAANIHYLGWIQNTDIDHYIRLMDAVIVPSRQEGFGLVVVEAMRNGVPAIVSNAGGLPELVRSGHNGYVFPLDDAARALPEILDSLDKNALPGMGRTARRIYEDNFTGERVANGVLSVYERVLYTANTSA